MPYQIIHGDEEFFRLEELARLKAEFTQQGLGDLNCTSLDGRKLTIPILREACETMPFLAEHRLVLVYDLLVRCDSSTKGESDEQEEPQQANATLCKELIAYLAVIPAFTHLAFCESVQLNARNPVLRYAQGDKGAVMTQCVRLDNNALHGWIQNRIVEKHRSYELSSPTGKKLGIDGDAARALINQTGNNLRQLDLELDKLAGYTNYGQIQVEHVRRLASENLEARIFGMVDALGKRDRKAALHELEVLLATGAHPLYILTMIVRQYRLLIIAKELIDEQHVDARRLAKELQVHDYAADRLAQQTRLYHQEELGAIYDALVLSDQQIKTGKIEGELALELLVLDITRGAQQERYLSRILRASSSSSSSPEARSR
ncbi:MAG: DNA polymerase III subunit delta [Chloroflexi bacterium]|nr:DNA polymerase III subunit delta [Chloroflexota bacterium]